MGIMIKTNDTQMEIADNNRELIKQQNKLKKEENEFNVNNTYPAFDFEIEKSNETSKWYKLKKTKGEMNNVSFSVFETIQAYTSYSGKPLNVNIKIYPSIEESEESSPYIANYPYSFDTKEVTKIFNEQCIENNLNLNISNFTISRYYHVTYMDFQHIYKDEYYRIGKNGIGIASENPSSYTTNSNSINAIGGIGGKISGESENEWLANSLFRFTKNTLSRYD